MGAAGSEYILLTGGTSMPRIGLGTSPLDDAGAEIAVVDGLAAGHRLVDTAANYGNEVGVGRGIRRSGLDRDELFVTTKFNAWAHSADGVRTSCGSSLDALGLDRVDLLLVHWPNPWLDGYVDAWNGMLELRREGLVRAVGVSNFKPAHLERLVAETGVPPEVNQVQLNPRVPRAAERSAHRRLGVVTQGYSPLGGAGGPMLADPVVAEVARARGTSPASVLLRWQLDLGACPVVKSASLSHAGDNLDVGDPLDAEALDALDALDAGDADAADSDVFGH